MLTMTIQLSDYKVKYGLNPAMFRYMLIYIYKFRFSQFQKPHSQELFLMKMSAARDTVRV
jgi:hypothetical protein